MLNTLDGDSTVNMMTLSNGNTFRVTGHLCGEFTGHRWISTQRPGMRSFDVFLSVPCAWINDWVNNRQARDLGRHRAHFDVIVMNMKGSLESIENIT